MSVISSYKALLAALIAFGVAFFPYAAGAQPVYDAEIVATYPHDSDAFTQGLFIENGVLYESTGLFGRSTIRIVDLETGAVKRKTDLPDTVFGEGVAPWKNRIVALTWRAGQGYVYDRKSLKKKQEFSYSGEGWGLTSDGARLIMSDGTPTLRFLDPETLQETSRITVTYHGKTLRNLNELEWIDGEVFANVWQTDLIVRINPESGEVVGVIDLRKLRASLGRDASGADVLNGVAYDRDAKRLYVTGKLWPKLFEVRLVPRASGE